MTDTQHAANELIEVLDDAHLPVGSLPRSEVHGRRLWHRTFNCWVLVQDHAGSEPSVIIQRRAGGVSVYPKLLDTSAAGHVLHNETVLEGGMRELREELGLALPLTRIHYTCESEDSWQYGPDLVGREVCSFFYAFVSVNELHVCDINAVEVAAVYLCQIPNLLDTFGARGASLELRILWPSGDTDLEYAEASDFVPHSSGHYLNSLLRVRDQYRSDHSRQRSNGE